MLNLRVKSFNLLTSTLIHGGEKLGFTIRILLESLQHVLKMYTWSLSENQASIQFRCRLIGLMLKQSLFRKYDLIFGCTDSIMTIRMCLWHLNFLQSIGEALMHISENNTLRNWPDINSMVVEKVLPFSSDELGGVGHCFTWHV